MQQASKAEDQAASLQKAPPADAAQLDAEVRDVAAAAEEANQKLPAVTTAASTAKEQVAASTAKSIDAIGAAGARVPVAASDNLARVGLGRCRDGGHGNANRAVLHLERLAATTVDPAQRRELSSKALMLRRQVVRRP